MANIVLEINDESFDSNVLKADFPVFVVFWAPWCGPCKAIGPIVEELAESFGDKIKFTKFNVDDNPITPGKYEIKAIPTLIFFKKGEVSEKIVGVVPKSRLENKINELV